MYMYSVDSKEIEYVFAEQFAKTLFQIRNTGLRHNLLVLDFDFLLFMPHSLFPFWNDTNGSSFTVRNSDASSVAPFHM